jgi:hypothetical protein
MGLVCKYDAKRATVSRETSVPIIQVFTVGDRSGDGLIRVSWDARLDAPLLRMTCCAHPP